MTTDTPTFPPLLRGERAPEGIDTFQKAKVAAMMGADPGLIVWSPRVDAMEAAIVLAPECPLEQAISIVFAPAIGFVDALGALGPPELAIHHVWPGTFRVNGAFCGGLQAAASTGTPDEEPDWLVVGIQIPMLPTGDGGEDPTRTCVYLEGCPELTATDLLESWSRHTLTWIHRWLTDGLGPLHAAWRDRAWEMGKPLEDGSGTFMGLDDLGGMLVKSGDTTRIRPLIEMLEGA